MSRANIWIGYTAGGVKYYRAERDGIKGYGDTEEKAEENLKYWEWEAKKYG